MLERNSIYYKISKFGTKVWEKFKHCDDLKSLYFFVNPINEGIEQEKIPKRVREKVDRATAEK